MAFGKSNGEKKSKGTRFPWGRFLAWKTSDISAAGLSIIITGYLTIYCTNYLGLSGTLVGTILLVSNIIDAITDLIAGFIIDNTHSKLGKGRPYEIGIVGMWICTFLMFSGPANASQTVKVLWVFFMYTFIFGVFNTLRGAGSTAYMIRAFDNDRNLLGKVGSYPAAICCHIWDRKRSKKKSPVCIDEEQEGTTPISFVSNIKDGSCIGFKYFRFDKPVSLTVRWRVSLKDCSAFQTLSTDKCKANGILSIHTAPNQPPVAQIPINSCAGDWQESGCSFLLEGKRALYFSFCGKGAIDILNLTFH